MKKSFSLFLSALFLSIHLDAAEALYLMPRDGDAALRDLAHDLENAKKNIRISIYSFTHKTLAKSLKRAAARGVSVTIIFDEGQNKKSRYTRLGDLAKIKNIHCYTLKGIRDKKKGYYGKMHMKVAIIDEKKSYFGSANWSYSAFSKNFELLYATDSKPVIQTNRDYFDLMRQSARPYYR